MTYTIKQNDTLPALEAQLLNADGTAINLELCTIDFHMTGQGKIINKQAEISDAATGSIKYNWQLGDTDTAGIFKSEFQINFPDGTILTVPNDGYFLIEIVKEVG